MDLEQTIFVNGQWEATVTPDRYTWRSSTVGSRIARANDDYGDVSISDLAIFFHDSISATFDEKNYVHLASGVKGVPLQINDGDVNLRGYWPLDDHTSGTALNTATDGYADLSGNKFHGTGVDGDGNSFNIGEEILSYP